LHATLCASPQGLSEYELLNTLSKQIPAFQTDRADPLSLFRQHFLLFHCLYRLQQELFQQQRAQLEIGPLHIVLRAYQPGPAAQLALADPLRDYYLDLHHLIETGAEDVAALLDAFWLRMSRDDQRADALWVLGLNDPVDDAQIRRRYRELVMRHHPDRGGETARLQLFNAAVATLLPNKT
jgi:hypothetical protein